MKTFQLTETERMAVRNLIADEYSRVRRSKAKHWRPSTKAMTLEGLKGLFDKFTGVAADD